MDTCRTRTPMRVRSPREMSDRGRFGDLRDRLSSFRTRLRLFFVLVVVIPTIAMAVVIFALIAESEHGQADARIAARQEAAISLYYDERDRASRLAERIGRRTDVADALRANDRARLARLTRRLLETSAAERLVFVRRGKVLADAGSRTATFPALRELSDQGRSLAILQASITEADEFARLVKRVTTLDTIVRRGPDVLAATLPGAGDAKLPAQRGTVTIDGREYRAASFSTPGFRGGQVQVSVLEPEARTADAIRQGREVAGLILVGFFLFALTAAVVVSRALQGEIGTFLAAARRIGAGDFSAQVPTRGRDEFAQLGGEFNKMSQQLERRLDELRQERIRLELSLRRIGETFAANLDRFGLLEIVVRTAVDAVDAEGGQARLVEEEGGELVRVANLGEPGQRTPAVTRVEGQVLSSGAPSLAEVDGGHAISHPLRAGPAAGAAADHVTGLITVWRGGAPFSQREQSLFHYLARQAAVSVENVGLHETVERQAITDELTGLSNRRRFQDTLTAEVERAKRFDQQLGLVLLDIDDFKAVNDTYGHQQGDIVLREVARVLRDVSREIDEPARYGGEELAVVLPGTDLTGAYNLAERVREGIEALRMPILGDESAEPLRVTASFGVSALPGSGDDVRSLIAAADGALYEAKHAGKNRTMRAG